MLSSLSVVESEGLFLVAEKLPRIIASPGDNVLTSVKPAAEGFSASATPCPLKLCSDSWCNTSFSPQDGLKALKYLGRTNW